MSVAALLSGFELMRVSSWRACWVRFVWPSVS